ncbi:NAD(P)/FAD-dependent oxidoreductase [Acinetobacter sp. Ver3]|uniref:NAD(P)/FAD-dependent oxidoreductase n=1 Tax=Acinetobacter sp. Ver3 TaxID=466088 RepID=UPI000446757D|nr:FAD-dependent oxidoreductase [Acinetobacter sp. Ver3]EZQ00992.1 pyridine nucleotide-disulfide oxidoreductase [Acinetobacter sp. Ver3]
MDISRVVIIGASHAGAQLSASLRQEGWTGEIILIGDEPYLPYHRPPLSKTFLAGSKSIEDMYIRPKNFYEKNKIQLVNGHVTKIDCKTKIVYLENGNHISYDKLVLCTGARVRKLDINGSHLPGVHYIRNAQDILGLKSSVKWTKRAVIVGGGYIGLETAASLRKMGINVTILEYAPKILQRVAASQIGDFFNQVHTEEGVEILTNIRIAEIAGTQSVTGIYLENCQFIPTELVIVGIGVLPNIELAEEAGLKIDNGIVVDEYCYTSDPHILAVGDCTSHFNEHYKRQIRLESVPNANDQAKVAAKNLCGKSQKYQCLPWFWSDQYDIKLQIVGLNNGFDEVILRGDMSSSRSFALFYFKNNEMIAADCVSRPLEFMLSKKIISEKLEVYKEKLSNENFDLKESIVSLYVH